MNEKNTKGKKKSKHKHESRNNQNRIIVKRRERKEINFEWFLKPKIYHLVWSYLTKK